KDRPLRLAEFIVDGNAIPEVDFDIGESYAGLLPISRQVNSSLFFWYFPSKNPQAAKEITIWLDGGPGCSSLHGMIQENGPFLWQPGTYRPIRNPYAWTNLTNMLYVDQPAGTGFSGPATVKNIFDVASDFKSWFKGFIDTFELHGYKVYLTGESYAGHMIPYIASEMLDEKDSEYFNVKGVQINDPIINDYAVLQEAPAVAALNHFQNVFAINETLLSQLNAKAERCGYTKFLSEALTYPPPKIFPKPVDPDQSDCPVYHDILNAAMEANPCFNMYHLTDFCPFLWNVMGQGFPGQPVGPNNYFNRSDVQRVLNIPPTDYSVCGSFAWSGDGDYNSLPSALGPLPGVIERTNNTIIAHGWLDYLLLMNGTLATIQNMTWNGAQGFQRPPTEPLFVPSRYRLSNLLNGNEAGLYTLDTAVGTVGTAHTERGLTFASVYLAGHALPQYAPGAAYRQLEFLLGRIQNLQEY
ncbi:unnamed protein product, partial [Clonostachys rosea]